MAGVAKNRESSSPDFGRLIDKLTTGEKLFTDILHKVHNGNIDEMFNYFKECCNKIEMYGNTHEKALMNYCSFKTTDVLKYYNAE